MISKEKKQAIMKEYARCEGDTGSPEVQVAVLTARIQELTEHLQTHPSLPCVSTPADIFLVFRTLLNCLKCIIYEDCYKTYRIRER